MPTKQVFTNTGPRERQTPVSQRVGHVEAQDTSSSHRNPMSEEPEVFPRAAQRDARAKRDAARKAVAERETAEAAPEETQAADRKPAARAKTTAKKAADSEK